MTERRYMVSRDRSGAIEVIAYDFYPGAVQGKATRMDKHKPMGANVKKLLSLTMARIAVPPGAGMAAGIEAMLHLPELSRQAMAQVELMLQAVKSAPDNPYGDDDEAIAGEIVRRLESGDRP